MLNKDAQTQNLYCYVLTNPMRYVDPTGPTDAEGTDSEGGLGDTVRVCWDWLEGMYQDILNLEIHGIQGPSGHYANRVFAQEYVSFISEHPEWEANGLDILDYGFMTGQVRETTFTAKDLDLMVSIGLSVLGLDSFKDFADLAAGKSVVSGEQLTSLEKFLIILPFVSTAMVKGAKVAIEAAETANTVRLVNAVATYDDGVEAIYKQTMHGVNIVEGASEIAKMNRGVTFLAKMLCAGSINQMQH